MSSAAKEVFSHVYLSRSVYDLLPPSAVGRVAMVNKDLVAEPVREDAVLRAIDIRMQMFPKTNEYDCWAALEHQRHKFLTSRVAEAGVRISGALRSFLFDRDAWLEDYSMVLLTRGALAHELFTEEDEPMVVDALVELLGCASWGVRAK